jgi:phage FluMu gp28-like protein
MNSAAIVGRDVAFSQACAETMRGLLYPYQLDYVEDRNVLKAWLASRQIGKTRTGAVEQVVEGLDYPDSTGLIVSASERRAFEVLRYVVWWSKIFDEIAMDLYGRSIFAKAPSSTEVTYWNGSRIISLPANPLTASGYTGRVTWDEASKTLQDEEMFAALEPITSSGPYPFRMLGSAFGARGVFWEVCEGRRGPWSRHVTDLPRAVAQGCPRDIEAIRARYDSLTFSQEYLCKFMSRLAMAFPPDLLLKAAGLDLPSPEGKSEAVWGLGIDVGRTNDRTDIVWCCEYPKGAYQWTRVEHLKGAAFKEQHDFIAPILANPQIETCTIDATGLGMQLAEDLTREFPGKVQGLTFTNERKSAMVALARARMEEGRAKLRDDDADLIADFGSIERKVTATGNVVYAAKRSESGHADSAWAAMMVLSRLCSTGEVYMDFGEAPAAGEGGAGVLAAVQEATRRRGAKRGRLNLYDAGVLERPEVVPAEELAEMCEAEKRARGLIEGRVSEGLRGYGSMDDATR